VQDKLTQFSDPAQASLRAGRGSWRPRVVALAGATMLAGGLATTVAAPAAFAATSTTTTITSVTPPGTQLAGHSFAVHVSVTASSGTTTPTGSFTVTDGLSPSHTCTSTLSGGTGAVGTGSCQLTEPAGGSYTLTASYAGTATFSGSGPSAGFGVTVDAPPQWVTDSPPLTAVTGFPYSYTFTASGYPAPTYDLAPGAPGWLSIDHTTGALSGHVPHGTGYFHYSVIAHNGVGQPITAGPFNVKVPKAPPAHANLSVKLSCSGYVKLHKTGGCTLTVRNNGPAPAAHVVAVVSLPPGLSVVGCTHQCFGHGNVVAWNDGTINNGGTVTQSVGFRAWRPGTVWVRGAANSAAWNGNPHGSQAAARVYVHK
jgi:hypothetical protein